MEKVELLIKLKKEYLIEECLKLATPEMINEAEKKALDILPLIYQQQKSTNN